MRILSLVKFILILAATYLFARMVGGKIPYFIFYTFLGLFILSSLWSRAPYALKVSCSQDTGVSQVGNTVKVTLTIENKSFMPVLWAECLLKLPEAFTQKDEFLQVVFALKPFGIKSFVHDLKCRKRGFFRWGEITVRSGDMFGFMVAEKKIDSFLELLVCPEVKVLGQNKHLLGEEPGKKNFRVVGKEISSVIGIRKYEPGDALNRMHWKASARSRELFVKEYEVSMAKEMGIFLDLQENNHYGQDMDDSAEKAISAAASAAKWGLDCGYNVGLYVYGQDKIVIPRGRGQKKFTQILEVLGAVDKAAGPGLHDCFSEDAAIYPRGSTLVIITTKLDPKLYNSIISLQVRAYHCILVLLLAKTFGGPPSDGNEYFKELQSAGVPLVLVEKNVELTDSFGGIDHAVN